MTRCPGAQDRKGPRRGRPEGRQRSRMADSATLEDQCHPRKIFIGGLPHKATTQQLRDHFSRYGPIVDAVVLRWPDGRSRGFGYVTFSSASAAAVALCCSHQIGGRQIDVKRAVPGTNKLFVGGLPQNCAATELREHFEAYGIVSDAVVMIDPATSRSRGFGFVCFLPGQEGAAAVASALERYEHHRIRGKWIEVKGAVSPHKLAVGDGLLLQEGADCRAASADAPEVHQAAETPVQCAVKAEPQKVALPATSTTTMAAAAAAMNSPLLAAFGGIQELPTAGYAAFGAGLRPELGFAPHDVGCGGPQGFFATESLQRSLEQLLRRQYARAGQPDEGCSTEGSQAGSFDDGSQLGSSRCRTPAEEEPLVAGVHLVKPQATPQAVPSFVSTPGLHGG